MWSGVSQPSRSTGATPSSGRQQPVSPMDETDAMLGASEAQRAFRRDLERVAASDVTVLIEGESGAGKSLAARILHRTSARSECPLVEVQLAALAPSLIEAELFGHEVGAFTGAQRSRAGRFRRAQGGSLVLEAVETLPSELQVKLLRALQERVIEPLGSEQQIEVDTRLIATCGRDLAEEVRAGRFREDLYYRLAVVTLRVPPLRARVEDLADLAEHIGRRAADVAGVAPRPLEPAAFERLARHSWPGNVRELENALERVMVLTPREGGAVSAEEFDFLEEAVAGADQTLAREALAHGISLDGMTLAMIETALEEERGNVSAAARRLGLSRRAFDYRRRKLGEERDSRPEEA